MIISHKYKFIFIKTAKTAGTSIEVYLSQHCGEEDVFTPIQPPVEPHRPRNYRGFWNPLREIFHNKGKGTKKVLKHLMQQRKFYNHMPGTLVRLRVPRETWDSYYKFCVERNPWDKTVSHFHMVNAAAGGKLTVDDYLEAGKYSLNIEKYTDAHGRLIVDEVVRYEELTGGLQRVFDRLGVPFQGSLDVRAKSEYRKDKRSYQELLTPSQSETVRKIYAQEIAMHGYQY